MLHRKKQDCYDKRGKNGDFIKLAAAYDPGMDRPKDVYHINRIFYRGAVADDGKSPNGTQGDHQVGLQAEDNGSNEKRQNGDRNVERPVVEIPMRYEPVDEKLVNRQSKNHQQYG